MNLENYISQLLYRYQCVTVPGFGAFLTEIQSAQLIENTNSFFPPKKMVSFNALLKNNDGLLANHIAKSEKSSYESALNYINFEVESWNAKLQEFGQISINNVGDLYLNADRKIIFEPLTQINYLTDSFGLSNFKSPTVIRAEEEIIFTEIENSKVADQSEIKEEQPLIKIKKESKYSNPYLKYVAVFLIVGGIEINYILKLNNETIVEQNLLTEKKVQEKLFNKIQTATFFIENPLSNDVSDSSTNLNYHIIAISFHNKEIAEKESESLRKSGYKSTVLPLNNNGLYHVTYESFSNKDEAKEAELKIKNDKYPAPWILTQEFK